MRGRTLKWATVLVAGAVALAGCSNDGGQSGSAGSDYQEGPLDKYLSSLYDYEEYDQTYYDAQNQKMEEIVAQCMAEEGFDYVPDTNNGTVVVSSDDEQEGPAWDSLEFAETYGYGIISWPGSEDEEGVSPEEEYFDPNQEYVEALSESEQQAYYETLYGPSPTEEELADMEDDDSYEWDWTTSGCQGKAQHEVYEDDPAQGAWEDPEFADMFDAMNDMYSTLYDGNSEMSALNAEWAQCMAESDYPDLTTKDEAMNALYDQLNELYSGGSDEEYVEPSQEKLDEFKSKEIKQAVADWKCADKIKYNDRVNEMYMKAQEDFVAEYKDQLEALVAKYSQQQSS